MYESKEEITTAVEAIYGIASKLDRGEILTHGQIAEVLGVAPHEGQWDHVVNRVRKRLQDERGIATWPAHEVGYELLTKARQLELPQWRLLKSYRQVRRARRSVLALPEQGLTANQQRHRALLIERLADAQRATRAEIRTQSTLLKPSFVLPRRPVPA